MNLNNINSFIRVAEAGSFNKAAEELHLTSTALIKQINLLESDLELRLFDRTHRGLTLTKAGESLLRDAKYIMDYCDEAVLRAQSAMREENQVIRIGTSPIMPAQMMMDLWPKVHERCADLSLKLVPFENTRDNAREILKNLGQNIDVVTGFVDELLMEQRGCAGLEITREPLCCAVSIYHPLAAKERLTVEDLYDRRFLDAEQKLGGLRRGRSLGACAVQLRRERNVTGGMRVNEKVIEKTLAVYLPFLATENLLMEAVKRSGRNCKD